MVGIGLKLPVPVPVVIRKVTALPQAGAFEASLTTALIVACPETPMVPGLTESVMLFGVGGGGDRKRQ